MNSVKLVIAMLSGRFPMSSMFKNDVTDLVSYRLFLIAICSTIAIANQNYFFSRAAASLTSKLRSLSFRAILRQDSTSRSRPPLPNALTNITLSVGWFDEDKNSTGGLVSVLSDNPSKISGLAGVTLGVIVQSFATVIGGSIIGLVFGAKLAAVGIGKSTTWFLNPLYLLMR